VWECWRTGSCRNYLEDELVYQFYAAIPSQGELSAFYGGVGWACLGGRSKVTGERCAVYMNIVRVRKPWQTAHIDACDIQLIKVHEFGIACAYRRLYHL
jgi:hypothetical protein